MLNHFICGSNSFKHQDQEQDEYVSWNIKSSSPKKSSTRKICRFKSNKSKNKNPYSSRGLDKFATVLEDLEDKRRKIIEQMGSTQDISALVRFGYSYTNSSWIPIVIKLKTQKQHKPNLIGSKFNPRSVPKDNLELQIVEKSNKIEKTSISKEIEEIPKKNGLGNGKILIKKKSLLDRSVSLERCRVPYYWGVIIILILFCLAIYGRSFAIICTSIFWYLMPKIMKNNKNLNIWRSTMKKNESFVKKMSENKSMGSNGFTSFKTKNVSTMDR